MLRQFNVFVFLALLLVYFSLFGQSQAQQLNARQNEIIKLTLSADGWLTEDMHREFWAAVPENMKKDPQFISLLATTIKNVTGAGLKFQLETWESIRISISTKKPTKTQGYEEAKNLLLKSSSIETFQKQALEGTITAERFIEAAAFGRPVQLAGGPIYLTQELVEQTLSGIHASFCRFNHLATIKWEPKAQERTYIEGNLRIISLCPLKADYSEIAVDTGKKAKLIQLAESISEHEHIGISFIDIGANWLSPKASVIRTARSSMQAIGIKDGQALVVEWRGRVSSVITGSVKTSEGMIHAAARVVEFREKKAALVFISISSRSLPDALVRRDALELNTQLN